MPDNISAYWTYRLTNILTKPYYSDFKKNITFTNSPKSSRPSIERVSKYRPTSKRINSKSSRKINGLFESKTQSFADYAIDAYQKNEPGADCKDVRKDSYTS